MIYELPDQVQEDVFIVASEIDAEFGLQCIKSGWKLHTSELIIHSVLTQTFEPSNYLLSLMTDVKPVRGRKRRK